MCRDLCAGTQFGLQVCSQLFAQLHAPLVVGIDVPDDALHEYLVFIERYQPAQSSWRQLFEQDGIGRFIALEYFVRQQRFDGL